MNTPDNDIPSQDCCDDNKLASEKASHPACTNDVSNDAIIMDYCQNLEDILN